MHLKKHLKKSYTVFLIIPVLLTAFLFSLLLTNPAPRRTAGVAEAAQTLEITPASTPYFSARAGRMIDTVVIHYMSGINVDRSRWDDPQLSLRILKDNHVSAHYVIDRQGKVYRPVNERNVAWHAGGSIMPSPDNRKNVNSFSIGIELIATHKSGFTDAQYRALDDLLAGIKSRHHIRHIVGHDEIGGSRAVRMGLRRDVKPDPGPLFDWSRVR